MDSQGHIHRSLDVVDALKRGLKPIPPEELPRVRKMNKPARIAWWRRQPSDALLAQTPEDIAARADARRIARNKRKAASRGAR